MSRSIDTFTLLFYKEITLSRFSEERITRYACLTFALSDMLIGRADNEIIVFIEEPVAQNLRLTIVILHIFIRTAEITAGEQFRTGFRRYNEMTTGFLTNLETHLSARVQGASTEEQTVKNLRFLCVFICITATYIPTTIVHEQHLRRNAALMTKFPCIIPPATTRNETTTEEEVVRHLGFKSVFTGIQVENTISSQP